MTLAYLFAHLIIVVILVFGFNAMSLSYGEARPFIIHDLTKQRPIFLLLSLKAIAHVVLLI